MSEQAGGGSDHRSRFGHPEQSPSSDLFTSSGRAVREVGTVAWPGRETRKRDMPATTDAIALGPPGLELDPGDHLCVFYRGNAERDTVLLPYLNAGLASGDKCICVVDTTEHEAIHRELDAGGGADQLDLMTSGESYLQTGAFDLGAMLEFWEAGMQRAVDRGFEFIRAAGEMTWALGDAPGVEQLITYEAELNRSLRDFPQVILCFYDLERFTNGELLMNVMRTHPKVLLGSTVVDNPWYMDPDEFLATTG